VVKKSVRKKFHEALYYLLVLITIIFISSFMFFISPILYFGHFFYVFIVLMIMGVALGAFLKGFLKDLDELNHTHHSSLIIVILLASILNFVSITASFSLFVAGSIYFSLLSAFVFTISFLIPYAYRYYKPNQ
jgi:Kef-type K+ transport system membrane component KefB